MHSSAHYRQLLARLPQIAVAADQFEVLYSAQDFKRRILALIASATRRIYLVALYLQDDEAGREILSPSTPPSSAIRPSTSSCSSTSTVPSAA